MYVDLANQPDLAAALCREAHARLLNTAHALNETQMRTPSRLPGWTVAHVLTHLARNADGHARRLEGALCGEDRSKYAGGSTQRVREIETGATRPAAAILEDLQASQVRLESLFDDCSTAHWPNPHFLGGSDYGPRACPAHRLRETEMHHVDLDMHYEPSDWPDEYVGWDLPNLLASVASRLPAPETRRAVLAWLSGRGPLPPRIDLDPWG